MNFYLQKYGFKPAQIKSSPKENLGIIVIIPCFNEPDLVGSLRSLLSCERTGCSVEVIVVLNSSELAKEDILDQNEQTLRAFNEWNNDDQWIDFHLLHEPSLPKKHAGVGLARKIGMDEAVSRFDSIDTDGIIVCFDADAEVEDSYLVEIESHFQSHPKSPGCSIHFEHPLVGEEYANEVYEAIIDYEMHLRYYKQCQQYLGLPYAFHTVGSSMAVRSSAYQKQGGMNKRKAGEDFYFLHKIIALGDFSEIKTTKVIPSPRISDRVPFGTGRAVGEWIKEDGRYQTYAFETFVVLKKFIELIPAIYSGEVDVKSSNLHPGIISWLDEINFEERLNNIKEHSTHFASFQKRFFSWFDAFTLLKLTHYLRDHHFPLNDVLIESQNLLNASNDGFDSSDRKLMLKKLIERDTV